MLRFAQRQSLLKAVLLISTNAVYIPSIDGKDIFISNNYINNELNGYSLRAVNGDYNLSKFINTLDYSLDLIKLREVYERVYRSRDFSFVKNKKEYTPEVINVTFKYSNKVFNKLRTNTYVKFGHMVADADFIDCVCIRDGEMVGIQTEKIVESPISNDLLGKYFYFDDGVYKAKTNIATLNSVADIRSELYTKGFICNGIKYVRFKRSSGSSRVGKCLFIDEKLYYRMHKWEMCGIKVNNGDAVDLASLEPYIALTLSSIIDTIQIYPENILVVDDYKSVFNDRAVATRLVDGRLVSKPEDVEIANSIWDGQSLMDRSVFLDFLEQQKRNNVKHAAERGMLLLRARFFKSCCFNANIQQWFADNNITDVKQLNGYTRASKISDIKIITTPSSIKYLKFGSMDKWFDVMEPTFGVVKYEKKTNFFDGRMVQTHYQLLNTLQMTPEEVEALVKPSLDYARMIKTDPAAMRHQIGYQYCSPDDNYYPREITSKNDIVYTMLGINDKFADTKLYRQFRDDLIKSFLKNLRCGHILVQGNYSTLCGNPIEMLKQSIGTFDGTTTILPNTVHSIRFDDGIDILGSRSPHVTVGNVLITKNVIYPEITRYMNPTAEIVYVNSIGENLLERLSGSDFDSDSLLLTNNEILISAARRNYNNFLVPTKLVESSKVNRKYTSEEQADLDIKTSVNKIGEIINLSQELNSLLWDRINHGESIEDVMELYCDISQLDVMSGLEIDAAKRENPANNTFELKCLKNKYDKRDNKGRHIRPLFFKYIDDYKGYRDDYHVYEENEDNEYEKCLVTDKYSEVRQYVNDAEKTLHVERGRMSYAMHMTTMDYLQKAIDKFSNKRLPKREYVSFSDVLIPVADLPGYVKYPQVERLIDYIKRVKQETWEVWNNKSDLSPSQKRKIAYEKKQDLIEYVSSLEISDKSVRYILSLIDTDEYKGLASYIFSIILDTSNEKFYRLIDASKEVIQKLEEDEDGDIDIMGFKYRKIDVVNGMY